MRRPVVSLVAGVLAIGLVAGACSDDDTSTSPTTVAERTSATSPDTSSTAPASDAGEEGSAATTAVTDPVEVPDQRDECLVGEWTVSLETIGALVAFAVLPVPDLTVPTGTFTVALNGDGTVVGAADFTGAFTLGETPAEADVAWDGSGTWGTADGVVTLSLDEQEGGLTEVRLAGTAQPNSALEADLPIAGGPYTCTADLLSVTATAGTASVPLVFER